jgi:hypothetical protein
LAKVLDALSEQRAATEWRIARADPDDVSLEYDVYVWVVLVDALTDSSRRGGRHE